MQEPTHLATDLRRERQPAGPRPKGDNKSGPLFFTSLPPHKQPLRPPSLVLLLAGVPPPPYLLLTATVSVAVRPSPLQEIGSISEYPCAEPHPGTCRSRGQSGGNSCPPIMKASQVGIPAASTHPPSGLLFPSGLGQATVPAPWGLLGPHPAPPTHIRCLGLVSASPPGDLSLGPQQLPLGAGGDFSHTHRDTTLSCPKAQAGFRYPKSASC